MPSARQADLEALAIELTTRLTGLRTSCQALAEQITQRADAMAFLHRVLDTTSIATQLETLAADVAADLPALYTARTDVGQSRRRFVRVRWRRWRGGNVGGGSSSW